MADPRTINLQTPPPNPQVIATQQTKSERTLYNSNVFSVMLRNFVAGFFRAFGTVLVYFVFLVVLFRLFQSYVLPELRPMFSTMERLVELQEKQQAMPSSAIDTSQINQLLEQFGQRQ